jgi:uncharacterized membrane protein (DUF485 family)
MFHEPAAQSGQDLAAAFKTSLGVKMFVFYALVYGGFIGANILSPLSMETEIFLGLNLAVVYGFGLIILALIMALIYNQACNSKEASLAGKAAGSGE